jgi:hypothetical protein
VFHMSYYGINRNTNLQAASIAMTLLLRRAHGTSHKKAAVEEFMGVTKQTDC